jgi:hypothetical protein
MQILSSTIHRVQLTAHFPSDLAVRHLENVHCAAFELFTAVMEYLALAIKYFDKRLSGERNFPCLQSSVINTGLVNILKGVLVGPGHYNNAKKKLEEATIIYTTSIVDLGTTIGIELLQHARHIQNSVASVQAQVNDLSLSSETYYQNTSRRIDRVMQQTAGTFCLDSQPVELNL